MAMSSHARTAGSVLLRHLGPRISGGPASSAPSSATSARTIHSMSMISASEARADVAEVYASKNNFASVMAAKAELAVISAAEARADVAEVYASKEKDGEWMKVAEAKAGVAQVHKV
ncbi:hypothetical protein PR202_gb13527 [Eleusine coracana subsp. coracana]|uniref:Uncharacterized protein n=1 Tax=Eleusine coracana subsp. coracana TaxID=191504 RepID=A0AAV5ET32_ELECO|nr:hypothetical protein PR202_gb13527 [Eleusine coracana subsp. coracana]